MVYKGYGMKFEISKELLSEVLGINDINLIMFYEDAKEINYTRYANLTRGSRDEYINIYELAHKCKEWAYNKNYTLASYPSGKDWYVCRDPHKKEPYIGAATEPEAVFLVCQWILDNKDKQ